MKHITTPEHEHQEHSRRTIVKGAAWSVPVIAATIATPLAAASDPINPVEPPPLSQNGWVLISQLRNGRVDWDGRGRYPQRGIWVSDTTGNEEITNAQITVWFSQDIGPWSAAAGNSSLWTVPQRAGTRVIDGKQYYGYTTTYLGDFNVAPGMSLALDNSIHFRSSGSAQSGTLFFYAQRTVTVDGKQVSFTRGPVSL